MVHSEILEFLQAQSFPVASPRVRRIALFMCAFGTAESVGILDRMTRAKECARADREWKYVEP